MLFSDNFDCIRRISFNFPFNNFFVGIKFIRFSCFFSFLFHSILWIVIKYEKSNIFNQIHGGFIDVKRVSCGCARFIFSEQNKRAASIRISKNLPLKFCPFELKRSL